MSGGLHVHVGGGVERRAAYYNQERAAIREALESGTRRPLWCRVGRCRWDDNNRLKPRTTVTIHKRWDDNNRRTQPRTPLVKVALY